MVPPITRAPGRTLAVLAATLLAVACSESPTSPEARAPLAPAFEVTSNTYMSGSQVMTWDPIIPASAYSNWESTVCTNTPAVGRNANWQNPHNAYVLYGHPWAGSYFYAPWINAWNSLGSVGPNGHNWTKYQTEVSGNGSFVIRLLADNCSWIYLDGTLVGVQNTNLSANSYGLTLNGTHTLEFVIFDGGGAAGGKYILETTSNPPPPLNPDLDADGHNNDADAFPLNPAEWADSDGDGVGDNADAFPTDPTETVDSDGDGVGNNADAFPTDPAESADSDGDGVGNNADAFPNDPSETVDSDGDGVGNNADAFPTDPTESADSDGDGVGNNADAFPTDPTETVDSDGDGVGNNADVFDNDATEWADSDGDGVGNNADAFDSSNKGPTVVIGTCNTGVANQHLGNGSWFNDLIGAAKAGSSNHGAFLSAVASLTGGWKKSGLITGRDEGAITSCAARSK